MFCHNLYADCLPIQNVDDIAKISEELLFELIIEYNAVHVRATVVRKNVNGVNFTLMQFVDLVLCKPQIDVN